MTPFPIDDGNNKGSNNGRNLFLSVFKQKLLFQAHFLVLINAINPIVAINEAAIGANKALSNPSSCFLVSHFTVSVTPSINTLEFSSNFMILIILLKSSFEMNKVGCFPALTSFTPAPLAASQNYLLHMKLL